MPYPREEVTAEPHSAARFVVDTDGAGGLTPAGGGEPRHDEITCSDPPTTPW
ncbi:MAG: hypothetical protein HY791_35660 [Deltaproteobacteria bacterium]|nr:hypothetical protein [Deltaproteobacteria bacterium]